MVVFKKEKFNLLRLSNQDQKSNSSNSIFRLKIKMITKPPLVNNQFTEYCSLHHPHWGGSQEWWRWLSICKSLSRSCHLEHCRKSVDRCRPPRHTADPHLAWSLELPWAWHNTALHPHLPPSTEKQCHLHYMD